MKKLLIASAVAAVAVAPATSFAFKAELSGQVNSAVLFGGDVDDATVVDNNTSGSRFRFKGSQEVGSLKYGLRLEYQIQDNVSNSLTDSLSSDGGEVRYSDVWVAGSFGKIGIGKGDGAANGSNEAYGLLNFWGASEAHLLFNGVNGADGNNASYSDIDGVSRQNRVRYDSPNFSGFKIAASLDNGDQTELAASYNGKVLGGKLRAIVATVDRDSGGDIVNYSFAYKTGFGLGFAYSYGEVDDSRDADWIMASYDIGKLTLSAGTGDDDRSSFPSMAEGADVTDNELTIIGATYKPTKGVDIYLNYGDWDNGDGVEGNAFALGSRIAF